MNPLTYIPIVGYSVRLAAAVGRAPKIAGLVQKLQTEVDRLRRNSAEQADTINELRAITDTKLASLESRVDVLILNLREAIIRHNREKLDNAASLLEVNGALEHYKQSFDLRMDELTEDLRNLESARTGDALTGSIAMLKEKISKIDVDVVDNMKSAAMLMKVLEHLTANVIGLKEDIDCRFARLRRDFKFKELDFY